MIGLLTLQAAKAAGASRVLVADIDRTRLETAKNIGADETLLLSGNDLVKEILARPRVEAWTWSSKLWVDRKRSLPR